MNPATDMKGVFVHPLACCESQQVGEGTRIWAFAQVMAGAVIGQQCSIGGQAFIESGAVIGHRVTVKNQVMIWDGVVIEEDAFIGPGVIFTNDRYPRSRRMAHEPTVDSRYRCAETWLVVTRIGRGASLGAGVILTPGVMVGAYATIAAGSLVTRNVAPHRLIVGHPGRPVGWVCRCGIPLLPRANAPFDPEHLTCPECDKHYRIQEENCHWLQDGDSV